VARLATDPTAVRAAGLPREAIPRVTDTMLAAIVACTSATRDSGWVASMDVRALEIIRRRGFGFVDVGETDPTYLGSPSTPVALSIDAWWAGLGQLERRPFELAMAALQPAAPMAPALAKAA
jgi:hypothetical protein